MDRNGNPFIRGKYYTYPPHYRIVKFNYLDEESGIYIFQKKIGNKSSHLGIDSPQVLSTMIPIENPDINDVDTDEEDLYGGKKKVFRRRKSKKIRRKFRKSKKMR